MDQLYIYGMYVLLAVSVTFGQMLYLDDKYLWLLSVVRYLFYILTIQGIKGLCGMCYDMLHRKLEVKRIQYVTSLQMVYIACIAILLSYEQKLFAEDFALIFIAYLIVEYPEITNKSITPINYGVGMACNFYEGYLMNVIPSDGGKFGGFVQNIQAFESREGIVIPVKKLFIIITKSLYSPPDLTQFNKTNREDLPKLEACSSLDDVEKDCCGVKNRSYKNCAYKLYRPHARPVCLVAECATPLHTLHRLMVNKELYEDFADVDVDNVRNEFCTTLTNILSRSSECRDKVELVFYDDQDPELNLADVLLDRIRLLEPNFEELISVRR